MTKKSKIFITIVILLVLVSIVFFLTRPKYDKTKCFNKPENVFGRMLDSVVIDCLGYIKIEKDLKCNDDSINNPSQCGGLNAYDSKNNSFIASNIKEYLIEDGTFYIIGKLWLSAITFHDNEKVIYFSTKENGEYKSFDFEPGEEIPSYIVVDSNVEKINFYKNLSEMPDNFREKFKNLIDD